MGNHASSFNICAVSDRDTLKDGACGTYEYIVADEN